jgi:hypothetical protein
MMIDSAAVIRDCHQEGIYDLLEILTALLEKYENEQVSFSYCGISVTCQPSKERMSLVCSLWAAGFFSKVFETRHRHSNDRWRFFLSLVQYRHESGVPWTIAAEEVICLVALEFELEEEKVLEILGMWLNEDHFLPRVTGEPPAFQPWNHELRRWWKNRQTLCTLPEYLS